ncbi:hypothetical protein AB0L53_46935 [Nonomuraea sp. NPDC052129]|uniref:hypothetical protein n=1 Tax=Nonomuraea sp. NPDC052129 TaxID=3154651 RepID=UPI0034489CC2
MKYLARLAATAVATLAIGAVAGTSAPAQAATPAQAAALVRAAAEDTFSFVGARGTPSPKDITMHWRGTCQPGARIHVVVTGEHWGGKIETSCGSEGTFEGGIMIYDYENRGLRFGRSFTYQAGVLQIPGGFTSHSGQATLH